MPVQKSEKLAKPVAKKATKPQVKPALKIVKAAPKPQDKAAAKPAAKAKSAPAAKSSVKPSGKAVPKDELKKLIAATKPGTLGRVAVMFPALSGIRVGELTGATWGAIDPKPGNLESN